MDIEKILTRLAKVKKNNDGWIACCPAHADKNPSLSISQKQGKVLLKCFVGCDIENVVSSLGLEMKDLFESDNGLKPNQKKKRIVTTYDYTDENGNLLVQSVRYEPKDFRQRRPDGNGGYIWNAKDTRKVLYRLPEVLASELVFICEGEKDVEKLRECDYVATCNPQGALKWRVEYNDALKNKTVVILPDNDETGQKHALQVANSIYGIAKEVLIVELPNLKPKGDVSDFFKDGGTIDDIIGILDRAESWHPGNNDFEVVCEDETKDFISLFTLEDANTWIDNAKLRPVPKMLFGELWYEGELCILFADTGKGKSILAVQIGDAISKGIGISQFTLEASKQEILYFDFELSDKQFEARYSKKNGDYFTDHYVFDSNFKRGEINQNSIMPKRFKNFEEYLNYSLEYEIIVSEANILIVDNITYLKNATETAKDALPLMKELIRLKKKHDISILALAHTPKRDLSRPLNVNDLQGSKMLSNFADSIFAIGESAKDKNLRYLKQIKARNTEEIYHTENVGVCQIIKDGNFLKFEFLDFGNEFEHLKRITETDKAELIQKAKDLSTQGNSQRKIASELQISLGTVNNYLKK